MMLRGAGFVVHDLGVDTKPEEFIEAIEEQEASLIGMSALLTTTMPNMGRTIEAFEEAGINSKSKIKETGKRFRETVLSMGGSRSPQEVYKSFRGRDATTEALIRHSGLTKSP